MIDEDEEYIERAEKKFWVKVEKTENCWFWTGCKRRNGIGRFKYKGKFVRAHSFAWAIFYGAPPDGMRLIHLVLGVAWSNRWRWIWTV